MAADTSLWQHSAAPEERSPLARDISADVCVIGAGIAGLTTAYLLAGNGRSIVVIDQSAPGSGQTALSPAHLSNALGVRYSEIVRVHGLDAARLAGDSHRSAIARIESICARERISCDFVRVSGYLFSGPKRDPEVLKTEIEAAEAASIDVEWLERAPVAGIETGPCLHFPRQAQFHPTKYMRGLASAFERKGGQLYSATRAVSVAGGRTARVVSSCGATIEAGSVVIATGGPLGEGVTIHPGQTPRHSCVIAARVPRGAMTPALYWDTDEPSHLARVQADDVAEPDRDVKDLLIVGGEEHAASHLNHHEDQFAWLERWMRARFVAARDVTYRWSREIIGTDDGLACIGRDPANRQNVYVAAGAGDMGMTHGTIAAMLLSDLISDRENRWEAVYDPSRARRVQPL